jgi:hypothetical protein
MKLLMPSLNLCSFIAAMYAWTPVFLNPPAISKHYFQSSHTHFRLKTSPNRNFADFSMRLNPEHDEPKSDFFHRKAEIDKIISMLSVEPLLTIFLGPPSSGKTRLIEQCSRLKDADGNPLFHCLKVNLRGVRMDTEESFITYFFGQTIQAAEADGKWQVFSNILRGFTLKFGLEYGPASGSLELKGPGSNLREPSSLSDLIAGIPERQDQDRPYVLVVDEANNLRNLADKDKEVLL